jgi:hypothetical protein
MNSRGVGPASAPVSATPQGASAVTIVATMSANVPNPGRVDVQTGYVVADDGSEYDSYTGEQRSPALATPPNIVMLDTSLQQVYITLDPITGAAMTFQRTTVDPIQFTITDEFGTPVGQTSLNNVLYVTTNNTVVVFADPATEHSPADFHIVAVGQPYSITATPLEFQFSYTGWAFSVPVLPPVLLLGTVPGL